MAVKLDWLKMDQKEFAELRKLRDALGDKGSLLWNELAQKVWQIEVDDV